MTKVQGWVVIVLLSFMCLHVLAADVVGIKMISNLSGSEVTEIVPDDTETPDITPCGDQWPDCP
jgi:hypothetical protein